MDLPGINIPISVNGQATTAGLQGIKGELKDLGSETERTASRVRSAGAGMEGSFKTLALGMTQAATSAFALYQSFDDIEKKQYAVEKANLSAQKATAAVDDAQKKYNDAIIEYGEESPEAIEAAGDLAFAEETARLAVEKADIAQGNLNDQMIRAGVTVIPTLISGVDGLGRAWKNIQGLDLAGSFGKVKDALGGIGTSKLGILGGAITGFGAFYFAMEAGKQTTEEGREQYKLMAAALGVLTGIQWGFNIAKAVGLGLTGIGLTVVAAAAIAGAGMYALAGSYGVTNVAPPEDIEGAAAKGKGTTGGAEEAEAGSYGGLYGAKERRAEGAKLQVKGLYETAPEGLLLDYEPYYQTVRIPGTELKGPVASLDSILRGTYADMFSEFDKAAWLRLRDPDTGKIRVWESDEYGDLWDTGQLTNFQHFAKGGWALSPTIAMVAENEPELMIPESRWNEMGSGGNVVQNFYVDGARDVDLVLEEIARKLRNVGGWR